MKFNIQQEDGILKYATEEEVKVALNVPDDSNLKVVRKESRGSATYDFGLTELTSEETSSLIRFGFYDSETDSYPFDGAPIINLYRQSNPAFNRLEFFTGNETVGTNMVILTPVETKLTSQAVYQNPSWELEDNTIPHWKAVTDYVDGMPFMSKNISNVVDLVNWGVKVDPNLISPTQVSDINFRIHYEPDEDNIGTYFVEGYRVDIGNYTTSLKAGIISGYGPNGSFGISPGAASGNSNNNKVWTINGDGIQFTGSSRRFNLALPVTGNFGELIFPLTDGITRRTVGTSVNGKFADENGDIPVAGTVMGVIMGLQGNDTTSLPIEPSNLSVEIQKLLSKGFQITEAIVQPNIQDADYKTRVDYYSGGPTGRSIRSDSVFSSSHVYRFKVAFFMS